MRMNMVSSVVPALIVVVNMMWSGGLAESPSPDSECTNSLLSLINCESFLSGSNITTPPDSCCAGLNDLVKSAPTCLCGVIVGSPIFSSINLTRAQELPLKCGIRFDNGQCSGVGAPPPSPPGPPTSSEGDLGSPSSALRMSVPFWLWAFVAGGVLL